MAGAFNKELSSDWEFRAECEETWMEANSFPTEVHRDLESNGKIPDFRVDLNELAARWVADYDWIYRTTFETPPLRDGLRVDLVFEGLDTFATVTLNGTQILQSDNQFVSHRVPVAHLLQRAGEASGLNTLEIVFESARRRGLELVKEHTEHRWIVHQTEVTRGPVRKAQYQWGWDWGPILNTCGPWKPILLQAYTTRIEDVKVDYTISGKDSSISAQVHTTFVSSEDEVDVEVSVDGTVVGTASVRRDGPAENEQSAVMSFQKSSSDLWWPLGYGDPKLHDVQVRCLVRGQTADQATKKVGFRTAELIRQADSLGESYYFRINGVEVFVGGSCWIPADNYLTRVDPGTYRRWIELLAEGNQNMIRVWGGGIYEDASFYQACDELGILVWQDFMFACASYPGWPDYLKSVELEARQNVRRLRHHPSVVLWTGNNEDYQIVERYNLQYDLEDKDPVSWLKSEFPARYLYEHLLPSVVKEEANTGTEYRPSSPFGNGKSTTLKVDKTVGDVHQWNVWHGEMRPYQKLPEMNGRFVSEFGMEAYPHLETLHAFLPDETQRYPGSRTMDFHNKAIGHERRLLTYVAENFRLSYDLPSFTHITQVMQADAMAWAYKFWRRWWNRQGQRDCGGALVWQLNDCWPTISWAVVDYFLVKKPAFYAIKRTMEPQAVNVSRRFHDWTTRPADALWHRDTAHVDPTQADACFTYDVWVASSSLKPIEGEVELRFISIEDGKDVITPSTVPVTIQPNGTTIVYRDQKIDDEVSKVDSKGQFSFNRSDMFVLHVSLRIGGREVSTDVSWPEPTKYIDFANRGVKVTFNSSPKGTTAEITADKPTKGFVFSEKRGVRVSDNGFDLIPGRPKSVEIESDEFVVQELEWRYIGSA
ncbi:family 2 glycosyl hydrolase [Thozetella sp. PMI_491]|nr:family 2 glycosyl hydrolase [Thozetella sp. PMI_491]